MANITNRTDPIEYFIVGWFMYPKELDINYEFLEMFYIVVCVASLPLNVIFLAMIIRNPGSKTWNNKTIILANLCILNLVVNGVTTVSQFDVMNRPDETRYISREILSSLVSTAIFL